MPMPPIPKVKLQRAASMADMLESYQTAVEAQKLEKAQIKADKEARSAAFQERKAKLAEPAEAPPPRELSSDPENQIRREQYQSDRKHPDFVRIAQLNAQATRARNAGRMEDYTRLRSELRDAQDARLKRLGKLGIVGGVGAAMMGTDEDAMARDDIDEQIRTAKVRPQAERFERTGFQKLGDSIDAGLRREDTPKDSKLLKFQERLAKAMSGVPNIVQGAAEIPLTLATGMAAFPLAVATGARAGLEGAPPDPQTGRRGHEQAFADTLERFTYRPRSAAGQEGIGHIADAVDYLKIPPYVPGFGQMATAARVGARYGVPLAAANAANAEPLVAGAGPGRSQLGAVKQPGGHWEPGSAAPIITALVRENSPPHVAPWAKTMAEKYLREHAGSPVDPANRIPVGRGDMTYEQAMDRSVRSNPYDALPANLRPPNARAGEDVWRFRPTLEVHDMLNQAGDIANALPERDLTRKTLPQIMLMAKQAADRKAAAEAKTIGAQKAAISRTTAEFPEPPVMSTDVGKFYRVHSNIDPEYAKRFLSADSCLGGNCLGGGMHNVPKIAGHNEWVPVRNVVTGQKWPEEIIPGRETNGENYQRWRSDTNPYLDRIRKKEGDVFALRDEDGLPVGAFNLIKQARQPMIRREAPGVVVPRAEIQQLIAPRRFLQWQREQQRLGVALEQRLPQNPGGGENVPDRGALRIPQLRSIAAMHPEIADRLQPYFDRAGPAPQDIIPPDVFNMSHYLSPTNKLVSPRYAQMTTEMMRQLQQSGQMSKTRNDHARYAGVGNVDYPSVNEAISRRLGNPLGDQDLHNTLQGQHIIEQLKGVKNMTGSDEAIMRAALNYLKYR